ncbi:carboxypeptidase Q-like [Oratosquilla oratoria]|uniref:carboxypeptidase Q-like n=1 Tax=Oratosquilla oratoria TaxID=337810 RepID=UPI003F758A86
MRTSCNALGLLLLLTAMASGFIVIEKEPKEKNDKSPQEASPKSSEDPLVMEPWSRTEENQVLKMTKEDPEAGRPENNEIEKNRTPLVPQDSRTSFEENGVNLQRGTSPEDEELECNLSSSLVEEIQKYQPIVDKIIDYVVKGDYKGKTYEVLAELVDTFGPRITGSGTLEEAIDWMLVKSLGEKLENVHTEDAKVPHWVRNNESLWMTSPRLHKMNLLGLGGSVGTPPGGIAAEVIVVNSFDELDQKHLEVPGKIVVYNPPWKGYGETVKYRSGASKAARYGAVASLVRSIAPFSINSPHTGWQHYDEGVPKIPNAAITIEDAAMMERMQKRGQRVELHLQMQAENYPQTVSRNTIAEIRGYERPEEVVVVSGHLDSWDVGQGAMDDGGGAMVSWNSAVVLQRLGLRPRRTLRAILWTGEEQGLWGSFSYFNDHKHEKDLFQLMLESDIGTFSPLGVDFDGTNEAKCILKEILSLLKPINTTSTRSPMDGGPDIEIWRNAGVPTGSLYNANDEYFWFHHSDGDTMSVEDSDTLDRCTALWTAVAYVAADISATFPR